METIDAVDRSFFDARGQWAEPVQRWTDESEDRLDAATWAPVLRSALETLPPRQRQVVLLRDVDGLSSAEVCSILSISSGSQRVLLHRGRTCLREVLQAKLQKG
jgi:RNA polymerase sigma-70 factor (ECF subfamily)